MSSLTKAELLIVLFPLGLAVLLVFVGMLLWRKIADQHLYAFTAACAFVLLAGSISYGFFFPVEVITSACSTALLVMAIVRRKPATFALVGGGSLIGYFAFILTIGFHDLRLAAVGMVFAPNEVIVWINTLFLFVLLPIALAAGVLSFARALRPWRHKPAPAPAIPTA